MIMSNSRVEIFRVLLITTLLSFSSVYADTVKVVYDLTTGDRNKIEKHLIYSITAVAKHYASMKKKLKVMVVISGDSYKYFVNDLASPENAISNQLKASLISISLFVVKHLEEMRTDRSLNFIPILEISNSIREGLK